MIEQLAASFLSTSASSQAAPVGEQPVLVAQAGDVERFRAAMIAPQTAVPPSELQLPAVRAALIGAAGDAVASPALSPANRIGSAESPSIGDTILSGLRSAADDTRDRYKQIAEVLSNPSPSISDLMSLQFVILQNSLQFDLTSKLISKAPQTIDSIVKTQ